MSEPAEMASAGRGPTGSAADELARQFGIGPAAAQNLIDAGFITAESIRGTSDGALRDAGLDSNDIERIRTNSEAHAADPPTSRDQEATGGADSTATADSDRIMDRWMGSVRKGERPKRRRVAPQGKGSADVLRKWVQGDDGALEAWIQASDSLRPSAPSPTLPAPGHSDSDAFPAPRSAPVPAERPMESGAPAVQPIPQNLVDREETVVRWLTDLLDRVKSDQFDPQSLLQEVQELNRQLYDERSKRKQLDDELEHVKRGSIAVIKYVRSREAKVREQAVQSKDAEIAELRLKLLGAGVLAADLPASPSEGESPIPIPVDSPAGAVPDSAVREIQRKLRDDFSDRERGYIERETDLRRRIVQLEADLRNLKSDAQSVQEREGMLRQERGTLSKDLEERFKLAELREKDLTLRENELRTRFEEIRISSEELERKREPIAYKEKELSQWEQQLQTTKQAVELEARRIEQARAQMETGGPVVSTAEAAKLDDLRAELAHREEDLKAREVFLHQKMEELETLQRKVAAQSEAETMHADVVADVKEKKARSGVRRLDDLLFGGFPPGAQILMNGPAHAGKEVLARLFIAEGLKQGVPAIWVVTDKTYTQIREEMTQILPSYPEAERKGMVRYVDLYSRSLGVTQAETGVRLLTSTDKGVLEQLTQAVNTFTGELKDKGASYRLVFESVSTITAYLDTTTTFRLLQPFSGRRKMDGATSYFLLETGMHTESDLQTLEHMMDGSINLKIDQLKTFLSIRGIGESQSRAWIGYTFSKKAFSLGSFSLDHIR